MTKRKDPYQLEFVDYTSVASTSEMNAIVSDIVSNIFEDTAQVGALLPVYLIAQTDSAVDELKRWVSHYTSYGVKVATYGQMIRELWNIFGDARAIAGQSQIRATCRRAYMEVSGKKPSAEALDLATQMIDMCVGADDEKLAQIAQTPNLAKSLSIPSRLLVRYEEMLSSKHLLDPRRAAIEITRLAHEGVIPSFPIIAEDPSENDASQLRFYKACEDIFDIHVVRRNAADVSLAEEILTTDAHFAVSYGSHVTPQLLANTISELHLNGAAYDDIAVALPDAQKASEDLFDVFAENNIPFESRYQVPCFKTEVGNWFISIETLRQWSRLDEEDRDEKIERALTYVVSSPYTHANGIEKIARRDICRVFGIELFTDETAPEPESDLDLPEEYTGLIEILTDLHRPTLVAVLDWATGKGGHSPYSEERRKSDARAAATIVQYLKECEAIGEYPNIEDISNLSITQIRCFGPANRVQIMPYVLISYEDETNLIAYGMDVTSFAGYHAPGPFSRIMEELGSAPDPWQAERPARVQLLDMIRKSVKGNGTLTLVRSCSTEAGADLPPAPLYTEISGAWGGIGGDGMPKDLDTSKKRSLSEAEYRKNKSEKANACSSSKTGFTYEGSPISEFIKPRQDRSPHRFSPTDLETYWQCPRKWFVGRNGVGYSDEDATVLDDPRIRGLIIHAALMEYYREYGKNHPRTDFDKDAEAQEKIEQAFEKSVAENAPWLPLSAISPSEEFLLRYFKNCACDMIRRDETFLPGFTPMHFEKYFSAKIAGIEIGGVVDRIDMDEPDENGRRRAVIIDYKGSPDAEYTWKDPDLNDPYAKDIPGLHIQGLIYALLVQKAFTNVDVVGIVYRGYISGKDVGISFVPFSEGTKPAMSEERFNECMSTFSSLLVDIASGILEGNYEMRPCAGKAGACTFCNVAASCPSRIRS